MVNRPKARGTAAETAVVRWLRDHGWAGAERRALTGSVDLGDISGTGPLVWEVKAGRNVDLAGWLRETALEKSNARADFGLLVIKPERVGYATVNRWYMAMYMGEWLRLLNAAGTVQVQYVHLSGARIVSLRETMRQLPPLAVDPLRVGAIHIPPRGVVDPDGRYIVTSLGQGNVLLHRAGYGDGQWGMTPGNAEEETWPKANG